MKLLIYIFIFKLAFASISFADWKNLEQKAFPNQVFDGRRGPRTDALLIMHKGEIVFEKYDRSHNENKKHVLWSISKSITSLLLARAEAEGFIKRTDSICKTPGLKQKHCNISFENILRWTSGLKWLEEYENSDKIPKSSVIAMLYGEGYKNMQNFVLEQDAEALPGQQWRYSSGDSVLLASLLPAVLKSSDTIQAFEKYLYSPLGITDWTIEQDGAGNAVGSSHFYLRARDLLKIGQLVLQKGQWQNKQLLPKDWLDFILTVTPAYKTHRKDHKGKHIGGGGFWINKKSSAKEEVPWPYAPKDTILATGHWGQYLVIVPSLDLVAVRLGDTRDKSFTNSEFIRLLVEALKK